MVVCVRFGQPFVLHLEKTVAWDLLQKEILEKMKYFLRPAVCIQVCTCSGIPAQHAGVPVRKQPLRGFRVQASSELFRSPHL